ncbi:MAG: DNA/RNA nuclease SfsA [Porticoccaceae bacterium]|nr:DNA/RNA nuclease SfsA [Porticoccaceae bacterium]
MKLDPPLESAVFIKRYKRFFTDVELPDGSPLTIHCANTGSMSYCQNPDTACWFSRSDNPKRKLPGTLEIVTTTSGLLAGVNTSRSNHLVAEAIQSGVIKELQGYSDMTGEVRYGEEKSRIDLLLEKVGEKCFVEVKNVTLEAGGGLARFPDAVTTRGAKHLRELMRVVAEGQRAVLLYCVQMTGIERVAVAAEVDPQYAATLSEAIKAGVEVLAYGCKLTPEEIVIDRKVAFS